MFFAVNGSKLRAKKDSFSKKLKSHLKYERSVLDDFPQLSKKVTLFLKKEMEQRYDNTEKPGDAT